MMIEIASVNGQTYRTEGCYVPSPPGFEQFLLVAHNTLVFENAAEPNPDDWSVTVADIGFRFEDTFPTIDDAIANAYKVLRYQGKRRMAEHHKRAVELLAKRGIKYPVNEVPKLKEELRWNA